MATAASGWRLRPSREKEATLLRRSRYPSLDRQGKGAVPVGIALAQQSRWTMDHSFHWTAIIQGNFPTSMHRPIVIWRGRITRDPIRPTGTTAKASSILLLLTVFAPQVAHVIVISGSEAPCCGWRVSKTRPITTALTARLVPRSSPPQRQDEHKAGSECIGGKRAAGSRSFVLWRSLNVGLELP